MGVGRNQDAGQSLITRPRPHPLEKVASTVGKLN